MSAKSPRRRGFMRSLVIVAAFLIAGLMAAGWWFSNHAASDLGPKLITTTVARRPYEFIITEQGTVESANSVELRCEVKSRGGGGERGSGVTIITVKPEG